MATRTPADKAKRKARSLQKIGELIKAGTPYNARKVSPETLEIAGNKTEMYRRLEEASYGMTKPKRKKSGYR